MDIYDAVENDNLERVRLLIEQGADKDKGDSHHGQTPLRLASRRGHLTVVQYLVEQGASLDKGDNVNNTPLIVAAASGHLEIVRYLLEQGADRDKANNGGMTPLYFAASRGYLEIAMLLMSYGADLNARSNDGRLPIDVAIIEEMKQAIRDEPRRVFFSTRLFSAATLCTTDWPTKRYRWRKLASYIGRIKNKEREQPPASKSSKSIIATGCTGVTDETKTIPWLGMSRDDLAFWSSSNKK